MNKTDIINSLIEKNNYKSYLEIGLDEPKNNYLNINCENKECVDPYIMSEHEKYDTKDVDRINEIIDTILDYHMTSDEFFQQNSKTYDLIFIDGLHTKEQVSRDIINSLKCLNKGGKIVIHDCLPTSKNMQEVPRISSAWTGDVWKTICELKKQNIEFKVVDCDFGCGIVEYFENSDTLNYIEEWEFDWNDFLEKRNELLNVITEEEFNTIY